MVLPTSFTLPVKRDVNADIQCMRPWQQQQQQHHRTAGLLVGLGRMTYDDTGSCN
jgi:hypothetical protein